MGRLQLWQDDLRERLPPAWPSGRRPTGCVGEVIRFLAAEGTATGKKVSGAM